MLKVETTVWKGTLDRDHAIADGWASSSVSASSVNTSNLMWFPTIARERRLSAPLNGNRNHCGPDCRVTTPRA
jgi:hypothetical protein